MPKSPIFTVSRFPTRQFLVAKSRCTKCTDDMYSTPSATWQAICRSSSSRSVGCCPSAAWNAESRESSVTSGPRDLSKWNQTGNHIAFGSVVIVAVNNVFYSMCVLIFFSILDYSQWKNTLKAEHHQRQICYQSSDYSNIFQVAVGSIWHTMSCCTEFFT